MANSFPGSFKLNEPVCEDDDGDTEHVVAPVEVNHRRKYITKEVRRQVYQALLARSKRDGKLGKKDTRAVADQFGLLVLSYHFFGIILPGSELTFALLVKHLEHNASGGGECDESGGGSGGECDESGGSGGGERERAWPRDASDSGDERDESGAGEHDASGGGGECDESSGGGGEFDESAAGERNASGGGGECDESSGGGG
uniref:DUF7769 domain-containing protein n=1 Tax=Oryza meridionalis TaxID=40149 RepID=A0A0E0DTL4_9ORYZ